jgi:hypothetical protein
MFDIGYKFHISFLVVLVFSFIVGAIREKKEEAELHIDTILAFTQALPVSSITHLDLCNDGLILSPYVLVYSLFLPNLTSFSFTVQ